MRSWTVRRNLSLSGRQFVFYCMDTVSARPEFGKAL
jgi:hypothetical protein